MARIPNEELINIRNTFGVNPEFLLSDLNDYTMDAPIEVDDGIASIDTGLPIYTRDGEGGNNFLQYNSMEGAPGYIRPTEIDQPVSNDIKLASLNPSKDLDSYLDLEAYNEALSKAGMIDNEMFIKDRPIKEAKKTGILESIKNKGFDILDFIKGGGITGAIAKTFLGEQDPRAAFLRNYYGGKDLSNLTSTGSIASGLMKGYNPVSGNDFLNKISGGILPGETFGLQKSYTKRIDNIRDMLTDKYAGISADMTDEELEKYMSTPEGIKALKLNIPNHSTAIERYFKLKEERQAEAEALRAAELRTIQQRVNQGESLSSIGKDMYTGPGKAFAPRQDTFTKGKTVTLSDGRQYSSPK